MRIGISTSVIQRGQTGVGQYLVALVRALLGQDKHKFTLFVLENDADLFDFAEPRATIKLLPEKLRDPVRDIFWHQTVLPKEVRRLGLDVLHIPSYRRMLYTRPCPLVATIHDLAPFSIPGKYSRSRMLYGRKIVPWLAQRQNQIIATSANTATDVVRFLGMDRSKLTVIHNGLDHIRFFPGDTTHARNLMNVRFNLQGPMFLYVARLEHPAKNHVRLIEAFNQFKSTTRSEWKLALAGGDWHGAAQIHDAVKRSPFVQDIRCLGFVQDALLPDLYRAADVFVYPSLFEGFGLPPIEAMACGCPVIASSRGSLAEVLGDAAAVVDPEDVMELTRLLTAFATNPSTREAWRTVGLERARHFNWTKTAVATTAVYERAAAERRGAAPVTASH